MKVGSGIYSALFGSISASNSQPRSHSSSLSSVGDSAFSQKVERHIDDVKKGRGNLSKDVAKQLSAKDFQTASNLQSLNPKALSQYGAYATAFGYDNKARYVNGVNGASNTAKDIDQAQKDGEKLKEKMDQLVEDFKNAKEAGDTKPKVDGYV